MSRSINFSLICYLGIASTLGVISYPEVRYIKQPFAWSKFDICSEVICYTNVALLIYHFMQLGVVNK